MILVSLVIALVALFSVAAVAMSMGGGALAVPVLLFAAGGITLALSGFRRGVRLLRVL